MNSDANKEKPFTHSDEKSSLETGLSLSPRPCTKLKATGYIFARNKNRAQKESHFIRGADELEKRFAMPNSSGALGSAAGSGASIASPFQSTLSSQNYGAMSAAAREAMDHLDRVLSTNTRAEKRGFLKYIEKINLIPIHRLCEADLAPCKIDAQGWDLIKLAADMSRQVYDINQDLPPNVVKLKIFDAENDMKLTLISSHVSAKERILIVTVRGTVNTNDWLTNLNGELDTSKVFQDNSMWHRGFSNMWHRGFSNIALKMQKKIAKFLEGVPKDSEHDKILFTGHSAGGAIAEILYAMSMQDSTAISRVLEGFETIHCITFVAPPVSRPRIAPDPYRNLRHAKGNFHAVINEEDPVPLAQKEYILTLLDVYSKTRERLMAEDLSKFKVPEPAMQLSGQCLLLRDENPSHWEEFNISAYSVEGDTLQSKLFGNPLEHFMLEYQSRIYRVLNIEAPTEKNDDLEF